MTKVFRFAIATLLAAGAVSLYASGPTFTAVKVTTPPNIDGTVNDDEWKEATAFEGLVDAQNGSQSPENGKFWVSYDAKYIYFAARLTDSQPGSIKATEYRTNTSLIGDDTVGLTLDLSGSLSDFSLFETNPKGATSIQLTGGRATKREWTGEFIAHSRMTPTGWEAEMRIPWSVLPIPAAGKRNVRFNAVRDIPRLNRGFSFVYVDSGHQADTPTWKDVELPRPSVDRSIKLLPYAYAGYDKDKNGIFNGGLDLKTSLTDQIQLVGTVNPDFRNIENAILSLDFSRFARIADESRPFFQEGAEYMNSALFASQTIHQFDAGINSYGKINDQLQFGLVDTVDFGHDNATIANLSYAPNANDNYRMTVTQRSTEGVDNDAYLIRYNKQLGPWTLFGRAMGSRDDVRGTGQNNDYEVGYTQGGFLAFLDYITCSPDFHPGVGFFPETDFKGFQSFMMYRKPMNHGPLQSYNLEFSSTDYTRTNGDRYRSEIYGSGSVTTRKGTQVRVSVDRPIYQGSHDSFNTVSIVQPAGDPYRNVSASYTSGTVSDAPYRLLSVGSAYRPVNRLQLTVSYQKSHIGLLDLDTEQTIFGGNYDLGGDRSISGRMVRNGNDTNFYAAYRRSGNKGAEYYLILGDPNARQFRTSLILKVVVPFKA